MTTHRRRWDGSRERYVPQREPLTPERLADMIAQQVAAHLEPVKVEFERAALEAAAKMAERLAQDIRFQVQSNMNAASMRMVEVANKIAVTHAEAVLHMERACQRFEERQQEIAAAAKRAGVEALGDLIGMEIQRYDFERLIGEAVVEAVREGLRKRANP